MVTVKVGAYNGPGGPVVVTGMVTHTWSQVGQRQVPLIEPYVIYRHLDEIKNPQRFSIKISEFNKHFSEL